MVHLADVTGLDDHADLGAFLLAHQVVVDGSGEQQRRDRGQLGVGVPVREHDDPGAVGDRPRHLLADLVELRAERGAPAVDVIQAADDVHGKARQVPVAVHVSDLGELVVVDNRERQLQHAARRGGGLEQVALGADRARERCDQLLAYRVERWIGDLGEQLGEVVEQQSWSVRDGRNGRVSAHRADRFEARLGHRCDQDAQLFLGVAEHLLATLHRGMRMDDVFEIGQVLEANQARVEPFVIRVRGGEVVLDLVVLDDAVVFQVDEEHLARLETSLAGYRRRVEVEHTGLGGQDDQAIIGDPVASRAQPVAVQDRTDLGAVGENDAGRPVPRLHQRGVELIKRTPLGVHVHVVLPGLGDHHHDRMRQRTTAQVKQLQNLVEGGRVAAFGLDDRIKALELSGQDITLEQCLTGAHPVAVAPGGVDLTVVGDEPERVGQRPAREGVGRETTVDDGHRRGHPLIDQVGEEIVELIGREHALVTERARRQRREVQAQLMLGALAQTEGQPVQGDAHDTATGSLDKCLAECRHAATSR